MKKLYFITLVYGDNDKTQDLVEADSPFEAVAIMGQKCVESNQSVQSLSIEWLGYRSGIVTA